MIGGVRLISQEANAPGAYVSIGVVEQGVGRRLIESCATVQRPDRFQGRHSAAVQGDRAGLEPLA